MKKLVFLRRQFFKKISAKTLSEVFQKLQEVFGVEEFARTKFIYNGVQIEILGKLTKSFPNVDFDMWISTRLYLFESFATRSFQRK